ncbi:Tn3 family transposase [Streptomyces sioyaensis]|nr:transposase [Streptomyces sioyaensis]MCF3178050.1 Tn3 family transposase [Streptomyces sioyaensis]
MLDVLYDRDGGKRPEMIVTDSASYSDIVFGLLTLAGRPAPAARPGRDRRGVTPVRVTVTVGTVPAVTFALVTGS